MLSRLRTNPRPAHRRQRAFTVVELVIAIAVLATIAAIAVPVYQGYIAEARAGSVVADIRTMELVLSDARLSGGLPATLGEVGIDLTDPWGQAYRYLPLEGFPGNIGRARKDKNLHPINTDFDLYSIGADGRTVGPLTGGPSHDDIIRANNGGFIGYGRDY